MTKTETIEQRVSRLFHKRCSGIQIMLTDCPKVMDHGRKFANHVPVSDQELGDALFAFTNSIRKN